MNDSDTRDLASVRLENADIEIDVTTSVGPRVIRLARRGGDNVFAELPDDVLECPGHGIFHLRGGHRLWTAPEVPPITYRPDDEPVILSQSAGSISATTPADERGVERTITLQLGPAGAVTVDHFVENQGIGPTSAAVWAITQFPPHGVAVLPQPTAPADPWGVQPNRSVVFWPYADPGAAGVEWTPTAVVVRGVDDPRPFKVGVENRRGWLAYWYRDELFIKWSRTTRDAEEYADRGAAAQVYRNHRFIELETLSPLSVIEPGERIEHREVWRLHRTNVGNTRELFALLAEIEAQGPPSEVERE